MPDKHIDDAFVDQAWDNMRNLLDKEMPQKATRRRIIAFWFLGSLLGIILIAGIINLFWLQGSNLKGNTTPTIEKIKQDKAIKGEKQPIAVREATTTEGKVLSPSVRKEMEKQSFPFEEERAVVSGVSIIKKGQQEKTTTNLEGESAATGFSGIKQLNKITEKEEKYLEGGSDVQEFSQDFATLATIPALPLSAFNVDAKENRFAEKIHPIKDAYYLSWNLEASLLVSAFNESPGAQFGIGLDYSRKKSNFSFYTGLSYSTQVHGLNAAADDIGAESLFDGLDRNAADSTFLGNGGNPNTSLDQDNYTLAVNTPFYSRIRVHQINLPIGIRYRLNRALSLDFGTQVSYRFSKKIASDYRSIASTVSRLVFNNSGFQVPETNEGNEQLILDQLRNWDVLVVSGVQYDVSARFSVHAKYQLGVFDLYKPSGFQDFDQNLRIGINFWIR